VNSKVILKLFDPLNSDSEWNYKSTLNENSIKVLDVKNDKELAVIPSLVSNYLVLEVSTSFDS